MCGILSATKLYSGKYGERNAATTVTVIQFSGIKHTSYVPGSNGQAPGGLWHYKIEMGPVDMKNNPNVDIEFEKLHAIDRLGLITLPLN